MKYCQIALKGHGQNTEYRTVIFMNIKDNLYLKVILTLILVCLVILIFKTQKVKIEFNEPLRIETQKGIWEPSRLKF